MDGVAVAAERRPKETKGAARHTSAKCMRVNREKGERAGREEGNDEMELCLFLYLK